MSEINRIIKQLNYILSLEQKKEALGIGILIVLGAIFELFGVTLIIPFIQALLNPEELVKYNLVKKILDYLNICKLNDLLIIMAILLAVVFVVKNVFLMIVAYCRQNFFNKIEKDISVKVLHSYLNRDYVFHLNKNSAELIRGVGADVHGSCEVFLQLFRIISEILTTCLICVFIIVTDFIMSLSIFVLAGGCLLLVTKCFKIVLKSKSQKSMKYTSLLNQYLYQALNGIKEVMILHKQEYFEKNYNLVFKKKNAASITMSFSSDCPSYIIEAVCVCGLIAVVVLRTLQGVNPASFIPQMGAFAVAAFRILPSVARITSSINTLNYYKPMLDVTYNNLLDVEMLRGEIKRKIQNETNSRIISKEHFYDKIEIKNVSWHYPNSSQYILKNISLEINKGDSVAFIGPSGAGKTTLLDILLGLLQPQTGKIYVDGVETFVMRENWGKLIGYVPQSIYLVDDTLRNNIAFGIEEEDIDDSLINDAIRKAQLEEFVKSLPNGINTYVGESGIRFSGGQRQRVGIARALYHNPDILVLDEATSALDNETEKAVMESIDSLRGIKTIIIVAHRLSTIINCSKIFRVDDKVVTKMRKEDVLK